MQGRIPAEEILANRRAWGARTKWPRKGDGNRLDGFAKPEVDPKFSLESVEKVFTIGSCFARNIEEHFHTLGYLVPTLDFKVPPVEWPGRPSGILNKYTPASIYQELEWTLRALGKDQEDPIFCEHALDFEDGQTIDLELAGFVKVTRSRARERRVQVRDMFAHAFSADVVTLTLGLAEAWWDNLRQRHVQQMPPIEAIKLHPGRFAFEMLSFEKARRFTQQTLDLLVKHGKPGLKIFLTTSPVPLGHSFTGDDILVSNSHAKAVLRAVCGELSSMYPQVAYFPSYECVVLSNSPDVWADDQIHVNRPVVARIVDLLVSAYFQPRS